MRPLNDDVFAALDYALDEITSVEDAIVFLQDWREGDLSDWPAYREARGLDHPPKGDTARIELTVQGDVFRHNATTHVTMRAEEVILDDTAWPTIIDTLRTALRETALIVSDTRAKRKAAQDGQSS